MKAYLRRLWAALLGRPFLPLDIGSPIAFRSPNGDLIQVKVSSVTYMQDFDGIARLTVEARPAIAWLEVQRG